MLDCLILDVVPKPSSRQREHRYTVARLPGRQATQLITKPLLQTQAGKPMVRPRVTCAVTRLLHRFSPRHCYAVASARSLSRCSIAICAAFSITIDGALALSMTNMPRTEAVKKSASSLGSTERRNSPLRCALPSAEQNAFDRRSKYRCTNPAPLGSTAEFDGRIAQQATATRSRDPACRCEEYQQRTHFGDARHFLIQTVFQNGAQEWRFGCIQNCLSIHRLIF